MGVWHLGDFLFKPQGEGSLIPVLLYSKMIFKIWRDGALGFYFLLWYSKSWNWSNLAAPKSRYWSKQNQQLKMKKRNLFKASSGATLVERRQTKQHACCVCVCWGVAGRCRMWAACQKMVGIPTALFLLSRVCLPLREPVTWPRMREVRRLPAGGADLPSKTWKV